MSLLEQQGQKASMGLASRVSRRSFMGRLGSGLAAASVGASAFELIGAGSAAAATNSATCSLIIGTNSCPSYRGCACGCWSAGSFNWCDCCDNGQWCNHPGHSCHQTSQGPTCCNSKEWTGGCGTRGRTPIICRYKR